MKTKGLILNFILVFLSTSASLLSISLVLVLIPLLPTKQGKIKMIEQKRKLEFDYPAKIKSAADGFIPLYYPKKTRKNFLGSRYHPVGTLPNTQTIYTKKYLQTKTKLPSIPSLTYLPYSLIPKIQQKTNISTLP